MHLAGAAVGHSRERETPLRMSAVGWILVVWLAINAALPLVLWIARSRNDRRLPFGDFHRLPPSSAPLQARHRVSRFPEAMPPP